MKKFNINKKIISVLTGTTILLTGCGTVSSYDKTNSESINDNPLYDLINDSNNEEKKERVSTTAVVENEISTSKEAMITTTTTVTTEKVALSTTTTTTTSNQVESTTTSSLTTVAQTTLVPQTTSVLDTTIEAKKEDLMYFYDTTGKYAYLDRYDKYSCTGEDTIDSLCEKLNLTSQQLLDINNGEIGKIVKYPVKDEYYVASKGENISSIAILNGVDVSLIEPYSEDGKTITDSCLVKLHTFIGNETSYETYVGVSNVVRNNKIFGDKIVYATGFSGASNHMFVLNNSRFVADNNMVLEYDFDGTNNYTSELICLNAKDIDSIDGIPVAYLRTENDIDELAAKLPENLPVCREQYESIPSEKYQLQDVDGIPTIPFGGYSVGSKVLKITQ